MRQGPKERGSCKDPEGFCSFSYLSSTAQGQDGIALVMVLLVVSLASFIVIELTHSSTLEVRSNLVAERNLRSEYLLKSAVNFGRALIKVGNVPGSNKPAWHRFSDGIELPRELLGIRNRGVRIQLEIRPLNAKMPLQSLVPGSSPDINLRNAFVNLFELLGFNDDEEQDENYNKQFFDARSMVANLIDYIDADDKSYNDSNFVSGIEESLPKGTFPKDGGIAHVNELYRIPGFTPNRIRKLSPFVYALQKTSAVGSNRIDINFASTEVLLSLDKDAVDQNQVEIIKSFAQGNEGPFTENNRVQKLKELVDVDQSDPFWSLTVARSNLLQIIAKVSFGGSESFTRAVVLAESGNDYPKIIHREIY